ncbi:unnamed protein product [Notodromas monacha]|uniref:Vacuolar protein sorting-associated protein 51 homolog n=1 Tax=Notodromas monacha TaxID=399045 RepID=A0A7R9BIW8_9CRUS|nr:unnamed protein product [Notodromas monacha]CAG0916045.1 unnamed protein product [Notodromas monacha]
MRSHCSFTNAYLLKKLVQLVAVSSLNDGDRNQGADDEPHSAPHPQSHPLPPTQGSRRNATRITASSPQYMPIINRVDRGALNFAGGIVEEIPEDPRFSAEDLFQAIVKRENLDLIRNCSVALEADFGKLSVQRDEGIVQQYDAFSKACGLAEDYLRNYDAIQSSLETLLKRINTALNTENEGISDSNQSKFIALNTIQKEIGDLEAAKSLPGIVSRAISRGDVDKAVSEFLLGRKHGMMLFGSARIFGKGSTSEWNRDFRGELEAELSACENSTTSEKLDLWREIQFSGEVLKTWLRTRCLNDDASPEDLMKWLKCLEKLGEPHSDLCRLFLSQFGKHLGSSVECVEAAEMDEQHFKWLPFDRSAGFGEFVQNSTRTFLNNVHEMMRFFESTFVLVTQERYQMFAFCEDTLNRLLNCAESFAECEVKHKRLESLATHYNCLYQQITSVLPGSHCVKRLMEQVLRISDLCCITQLDAIQFHLDSQINRIKHQLDVILLQIPDEESKPRLRDKINALLKSLVYALEGQWRVSLDPLQAFLGPGVSFASPKTGFCARFKKCVLQRMGYEYLKRFWSNVDKLCDGDDDDVPPVMLLVFYRVCREYERCLVPYMFTTMVDKFQNPFSVTDSEDDAETKSGEKTPPTPPTMDVNVCETMIEMGRKLVDRFAFLQGVALGKIASAGFASMGRQMKSGGVKHVVVDLGVTDFYVDVLLLPDESDPVVRQTPNARTYIHFGILPPASASVLQLASGASTPPISSPNDVASEKQLVQRLNRLFVDCPEFYSRVHPRRDSVMTLIICIMTKALGESVRLCTFSAEALKQLQTDAYFLALRGAKFVTDEHLLYTLLDEVLGSAVAAEVAANVAAVDENGGIALEDLEAILRMNTTLISRILRGKLG